MNTKIKTESTLCRLGLGRTGSIPNRTSERCSWRRVLNAFVLTLTQLASISLVVPAHGHEDGGYSHDAGVVTESTNWMSRIPGLTPLSWLSIPGTHDTMADGHGGDAVQTQSKSLDTQLKMGIRALDIRLRGDDGDLKIYHGSIPQGRWLGQPFNSTFYTYSFLTDVLTVCSNFLRLHPSEAILMRVELFEQPPTPGNDPVVKFVEYFNIFRDSMFVNSNANDNLVWEQVRGKIVIMRGDQGRRI